MPADNPARIQQPRFNHRGHRRERFAPPWLLLALLILTIGALWSFYPRAYIEHKLTTARPDAITLAYLRLLVRMQPNQTRWRILLASQSLRTGDLVLAAQAMRPWLHLPIWNLPPLVRPLLLRWIRMHLYVLSPKSTAYWKWSARYRQYLEQVLPYLSATAAMHQARFVGSLGDYRITVRIYQKILRQPGNGMRKLAAFKFAVRDLLATGDAMAALHFARQNITHIHPDQSIWRRMVRLALLADRPRLAASYARILVGIDMP